MKKTVALILVLAMLLSLTGCGMSRMLTAEEIDAIAAGTITDGVYENTVFGIGCQLDEDWDVSTQAEILETNGWNENEDLTEQAKKSLAKPGYFYEMLVETPDQTGTVNVCVENVSIMEDPDISEADYARSAIVMAREAFDVIGAKNLTMEQIVQDVAGKQCHGYLATVHTGDHVLYQKVLYVRQGIYAAVITVSCTGADVTDDILSCFYSV